jgi:hypothetical protein
MSDFPRADAMTGLGFEWFVAWRHLRDPERRSRRAIALKVGLVIVVLAVADLVYLKVHGTPMRDPNGFFTHGRIRSTNGCASAA